MHLKEETTQYNDYYYYSVMLQLKDVLICMYRCSVPYAPKF